MGICTRYLLNVKVQKHCDDLTRNHETVFVGFGRKFCKVCYKNTRKIHRARLCMKLLNDHSFQVALKLHYYYIVNQPMTRPTSKFLLSSPPPSQPLPVKRPSEEEDHLAAPQNLTNVISSSSSNLIAVENMQQRQSSPSAADQSYHHFKPSYCTQLAAHGGIDEKFERVKKNFQ